MRIHALLVGVFISIVGAITCGSCTQTEYTSPKPTGYFRIDLPPHHYHIFDTTLLPFTFEYAKMANFSTEESTGSIWIHLNYPQHQAAIEMTYLPVNNNLRELMMNDEKFVEFHFQKADDVLDSYVLDEKEKIYGKIFDIKGKDVACPLQFWLTDSTQHYLRASLYFNFSPNNDSLQPVIDYIREDVMHLVQTFKWKNGYEETDSIPKTVLSDN